MISVGAWRSRSRLSASAIGGRPRPPWIRTGTRRSAASAKTGSRRGSSGRKRCARGWSLMPRAPRSMQRVASSTGPRRGRAGRTAISAPAPSGALGERPVVRRAEGGMPVGLVEAEDERPRDAVRALDREQLVAVTDHPVDVVAEMDVRVEDRRPGRQLGARELGVPLEELVRAVDRVHVLSVWRSTRRSPRRPDRWRLPRPLTPRAPQPCRAGMRGTARGRSPASR